MDNSVKATVQVLYFIGIFYTFDHKDEVLTDYITFNKRRKGELEIN